MQPVNILHARSTGRGPWAALGISLLLSACGQADAPPPDQVPLRPVSAAGAPCPELAGHYRLQDPEADCCGLQQDVLFFSPPVLPAAVPRDRAHAWQTVRIEGSPLRLAEIFSLFDDFPSDFAVVTPR